jgi:hypothetical protein
MGRFKDQMDEDARQTDQELASQISGLTTMTADQINSVAPEKADKEKLAKLLQIVKSATEDNNKVTQLTTNIGDLASTIVKVLKVLA